MFASRLNGWFKSLASTSLALLCIALLTFNANAQSTAVGNATVAAASDLKFAIEEVALQFEKETGYKLKLVFGSSGQFKTQIMQGAPFHLFMSADEKFVYQLADAGKTQDRGRTYAVGRIGIMVPPNSSLKADGSLKDLAQAIQKGKGKVVLTTVNGAKLTASLVKGKVTITDENGGKSTVTATDLKASNGVIHVIDTVLLPK